MPKPLSSVKPSAGISEAAFFRLFVPMAALLPFLGENAYFFFIFITAIDIARCLWYFADTARHNADNSRGYKVNLNKLYYGIKMAANILSTVMMIAGKEMDMPEIMYIGQMLFLFGVAGLTSVRYFIKLFYAEQPSQHPRPHKSPGDKAVWQLTLACTMAGASSGLWFLFFDHSKTVGGEVVFGALLLMVSNMLPIMMFAVKYSYENFFSRWPAYFKNALCIETLSLVSKEKAKWIDTVEVEKPGNGHALPYIASLALCITGLAILLDTPHKTFFLDQEDYDHFVPSAGMSFMLAGFLVATGYDLYQNRQHFATSGQLLFSKLPNSSPKTNRVSHLKLNGTVAQ